MLLLFYIILLLYLALTLLYAITHPETTRIPAWPLLVSERPPEAAVPTCQSHADCPAFHICLGGQCLPQLQQMEDCDPATGEWISYDYDGAPFAVCRCLQEDLYSQKLFGGNCNVLVGCGLHGAYNPVTQKCACDYGYALHPKDSLRCERVPAAGLLSDGPCEKDEVDASFAHFDPGYTRPSKCLKRPCSFDALTGKPLKHGRFVEGWGCVCDPRYGLFGVSLEGTHKQYLNTEGYDACALIYNEEPLEPKYAEMLTYFYLGEKIPLTILLFLRLSNLAPLFAKYAKNNSLMVTQKLWRYDFPQRFFMENATFRARQRYIPTNGVSFVDYPVEYHISPRYQPPLCRAVPNIWGNHANERIDVYNVLYWYPVCRMDFSLFQDRMVVNPVHLTFQERPHLVRFNAFVLFYEPSLDRWTVDLARDFRAHSYFYQKTNVPDIRVVKKRKKVRYSAVNRFLY